MADDRERKQETATATGTARAESDDRTGDPGRTPVKAEGDEQTIDESLEQKDNK